MSSDQPWAGLRNQNIDRTHWTLEEDAWAGVRVVRFCHIGGLSGPRQRLGLLERRDVS